MSHRTDDSREKFDEEIENIWKKIEKGIDETTSERKLEATLKELEGFLKDGVDRVVEDSKEKELKQFQIEMMINDFKEYFKKKFEENEGEKSHEEVTQKKIESFPKKAENEKSGVQE